MKRLKRINNFLFGFGLARKYVLFISVLLIIFSNIYTVLNIMTQRKIIKHRFEEQAKALTAVIAAQSSERVTGQDFKELRSFLDRVLLDEEVEYVFIFDDKGKIIADVLLKGQYLIDIFNDPNLSNAIRENKIHLEYDKEVINVVHPIQMSGEPYGMIIAFRLDRINWELDSIRNKNVILGTVFTLFGIIASWIFIRRITDPLNKLIRGTEIVSSGNFEQQIDVDTGDELQILGDSFNKMITQLKISREEIVESKEYTDNILKSLPDGLVVIDEKGLIKTVNPSICILLGYEEVELLGKPFKDFLPEGNEFIDSIIDSVLDKIFVSNVPAILIAKTGKKIQISLSASTIYRESLEFHGIVIIIQDITERKKMEEELKKAQILDSLGILAGGIAHDFNNLLTGILGNVSLAKAMASPQSPIYKRLVSMEKASHGAKDLTQQLLTFAKGGAPIKTTSDIKEILRESVNFILRGSSVKCVFKISDDLWSVDIDQGQFNQVINNLVINANQAMSGGGVIEIAAENIRFESTPDIPLEKGLYVRVSIKDNGPGIPSDDLKKIFDPYFTTKEEGSGLGLSVTYSIIKKHGGHVDVQSEIDKGATFNIYIPASDNNIDTIAPDDESIVIGEGKILFMDDEDYVREIVYDMLTSAGYEVQTVSNGQEALDLYSLEKEFSAPFDAVILDLTIPGGLGGKETMERLLKIDPEVCAIVSSGYTTSIVLSEYNKYGFKDSINKPYQYEELCKVVSRVLKNRKSKIVVNG